MVMKFDLTDLPIIYERNQTISRKAKNLQYKPNPQNP